MSELLDQLANGLEISIHKSENTHSYDVLFFLLKKSQTSTGVYCIGLKFKDIWGGYKEVTLRLSDGKFSVDVGRGYWICKQEADVEVVLKKLGEWLDANMN
jgi:hypothetical protein